MFPATGGSYEALDGIEVHTGLEFDERTAIDLLRAYNAPADAKTRIALATALKVGCKARAEGEDMTAAQLKFYSDALGRYPADVARAAVDKWISGNVFFPALAELHDACKRELKGRDKIETAIRSRHIEAEKPEEKKEPVTDEFIRAMRAKYQIGADPAKAKVDAEFNQRKSNEPS